MEATQRAYMETVAPAETRQLDQLIRFLCENEDPNLHGVYLHGSLAMRCFQPGRSDLDILVLLALPPAPEHRRLWAELLLQISGAPAPIEISFLHRSQIEPWRSPAPYDFHYSEGWRTTLTDDLTTGAWREWGDKERLDEDLAAHFTVVWQRGVPLWQAPDAPPLPQPPWQDYLHSITADLLWARRQLVEHEGKHADYLILNACRIWAAYSDRLVLSKLEGANWAGGRLPPELAAIVAAGVATYTGHTAQHAPLSSADALAVADYIEAQLDPLSHA